MPLLMTVALVMAGCTRGENRGAASASDSTPAPRQSTADTTTGLYRQGHLMTASIDATPADAFESDTLEWLVRADSCAMLIRATGPTSRASLHGDWWFYVTDGGNSNGPGHSRDVSASPDFRHLAYLHTRLLPADTAAWILEDEEALTIADIRRAAERRPDGSLTLSYAVVPTADDCSGDGCPTPLVSPLYGGARIGWTDDSRYLLLQAPDSSRWNAIDPTTLQPAAVDGLVPQARKWGKFVIDGNALDRSAEVVAGKFRFTSRSDSIFLTGPNRDGVEATRFVGPGVPVATTRSGNVVTAVRRENGRLRGVVYIIRGSSPSARLACTAG